MSGKYNMKKIVLWLFIIMVSGFAIGAAILVSTGGIEILEGKSIVVKGKFNYDINDEKPLEMQGVKNLSIRSVSTNIKLIPMDTNEVKAHFHGSISTNKENYIPELVMEKSGEKVSIEIKWPNLVNVGFMSSNLKLDVYIPSSYSENLELNTTSANVSLDQMKLITLRYNSVSGSLSATSIGADEFRINTTSGDLQAQSVKAKEITIVTTSGKASAGFNSEIFKFNSISGDLTAESFKATDASIGTTSGSARIRGSIENSFSFNSISGDLTADDITSKNTTVSTTSGRATIKGLTGNLKFNSMSGDLEAQYQTFNNNIQVETSSGSAKIGLPAKSQFHLDFRSTSGEIDVGDFPVTVKGSIKDHRLEGVVGSDSNSITINTMSGDARIYK